MKLWLAAAAALPLLAASSAEAQVKGFAAVQIAEAARDRALDFRITDQPTWTVPLQLSVDMLVRKDIASDAAVGVGLANMYERRRGEIYRAGDAPVRSREPAVTFQLRF